MKTEEIKNTMLEELNHVTDLKTLNDLRVKYLGKKGLITELNSEIKNEDYVFDKTAKIDTIYDSFDKAKLRAQELNLEVLSKHKEHTQNLEL